MFSVSWEQKEATECAGTGSDLLCSLSLSHKGPSDLGTAKHEGTQLNN